MAKEGYINLIAIGSKEGGAFHFYSAAVQAQAITSQRPRGCDGRNCKFETSVKPSSQNDFSPKDIFVRQALMNGGSIVWLGLNNALDGNFFVRGVIVGRLLPGGL